MTRVHNWREVLRYAPNQQGISMDKTIPAGAALAALALLAIALAVSACADTATLVYCLAVDGNINLKCQ